MAAAHVRQPLFGATFGMNNGADEAQVGQAGQDAIVEQAGASDGPFASMWRALGALKARLYGAAPGLTVQTSECLNSNYFFTWLRVLTTDNVLEDVPDDGWGVAVASDREEDMISVFGSCSMGSEAREATASFLWEEMAPAGERAMRKRGSGSSSHPPVPVLNTNIVARTGSFVVFEHNGMYMRGLALWFALYLPPKGGRCTPLMTEFKNQVVLIAYVYVAAFDQNCLVVRVRQQHVRCPPRLTNHSSPHRLCTRASRRSWTACHRGTCAIAARSALGTNTCTTPWCLR